MRNLKKLYPNKYVVVFDLVALVLAVFWVTKKLKK